MSDKDIIQGTAEAVSGILEKVPVYPDAIQPAAKEIGEAVGTVASAINAAFIPLRLRVYRWKAYEKVIKAQIDEEMKNVPPERIIPPQPTVAGPILEALRFACDEDTLRDMYVKLLATSLDAETAKNAHPAFVEILKQLSPDEARILKYIANNLQDIDIYPIVSVIKSDKIDSSYTTPLRMFSTIGYDSECVYPELTTNYIENLTRLGLVCLFHGKTIKENKYYESLVKHATVIDVINQIKSDTDYKPEIKKSLFEMTDFGRQFCTSCVVSHDMQVKQQDDSSLGMTQCNINNLDEKHKISRDEVASLVEESISKISAIELDAQIKRVEKQILDILQVLCKTGFYEMEVRELYTPSIISKYNTEQIFAALSNMLRKGMIQVDGNRMFFDTVFYFDPKTLYLTEKDASITES